MIRVEPTQEPATFDAERRKKGLDWLNGIQSGQKLTRLALLSGTTAQKSAVPRPTSYWAAFEQELRDAFAGRCAYSAINEPYGEIDHFIPQDDDPSQIFEWSNYRYANGWINKTRPKSPFPDPFLIEDKWFTLGYPSLLLSFTAEAPPEYSVRYVKFIEIMNNPKVIRNREIWRNLYLAGKLTIDGLQDCAPMLASAIRQYEAAQLAP
jgi:hypothetical protein